MHFFQNEEIIDFFFFEYVKQQGIQYTFIFSSFEIEPKLFKSLYFILENKKDEESKLLHEIDRLNSQFEYQKKNQFQQQISNSPLLYIHNYLYFFSNIEFHHYLIGN